MIMRLFLQLPSLKVREFWKYLKTWISGVLKLARLHLERVSDL